MLLVRHKIQVYAWIYYLGEPIAILLAFGVIYEVLWQLVRPYAMLRVLGLRLFWAALALAAVAGSILLTQSQFGHSALWIDSILLAERSARFVQVGVLIVFIMFISRLGLTWKHYTAGIVAGFGIAAGLQLALFELKDLRAIPDTLFVLCTSAAYNCAVLVWSTYFMISNQPTRAPRRLPQTDLARLDQLLRKYLRT